MINLSKQLLLAIIVMMSQVYAVAQESSEVPFTIDQFLGIIVQHHPTAVQAQIAADKGLAYITKARGAFDPKLYGSGYQKVF